MFDIAYKERPTRTLSLRVTLEAEIGVTIDQELLVDRSVRRMATRAAFPHGFVFEHEPSGLFLVALRTILTLEMQGQVPGGFANLSTVRIVTIHTVHFPFRHEMMIRHPKFRVGLQMAVEARGRILAGIHDEFVEALPTGRDMSTARSMAGFAAGLARHLFRFRMKLSVWTGRENPRVVGMAIHTGGIADERCAID